MSSKRSIPLSLYCSLTAILGLSLAPTIASAQIDASEISASNLGVSPQVAAQIAAVSREKSMRTPAQQKLDFNLLAGARMWRHEPIAEGVTTLETGLKPDMIGRVPVRINATVSDALIEAIRIHGGENIQAYPAFDAIEARVPLASLESLATRKDIRQIRRAPRAMTQTGPVNSEGDTTHRANLARTQFNATGAGTNVGVLSDGIKNIGASQSAGELGTVTVLSGQAGPTNNSGEGTAMLEIVRDLAPGASLAFASAFNGELQFAQNILDLHFTLGCDIIVDDVFYLDESPFEDGPIAKAVDAVVKDGALYFSSAGNQGSIRTNHSSVWEGNFSDGGAATGVLVGTGNVHKFGAQLFNTLKEDGDVWLFWSDRYGSSNNDYDVYITNSTGTTFIGGSASNQNGTQDPIEAVSAKTGQRIYVVKFRGESRYIHLNTFGSRLNIATVGQTHGHSSAEGAFSVAAAPATNDFGFGGPFPNPFTTVSPVEYFSSDGPRRIFYKPDGTVAGSGALTSPGGIVRQKPDITAADGVMTSVTGFKPFYGTSAAAPHAAAIAAQIKSYKKTESTPFFVIDGMKITPPEMRAILTKSALDATDVGVDINTGWGIVMPLRAIEFLNNFLASNTITAKDVTDTAATVVWKTNLPSSSVVEYGPTDSYGNTKAAPGNVTDHSVVLTGLQPGTLYHYRIHSNTESGSVSANGRDLTFVTRAAVTAPKLLVTGVSLTRSGDVKVTVTVKNDGGSAATNIAITKSTLGTVIKTTGLPTLGSLTAGSSASLEISFPGSVTAGAKAFSILGTYVKPGGGTESFSATLRVTVP